MRLSTKHANQVTVTRKDFSGGLNATTVPEMIGDTQLADAVNVGLDRTTGSLCTLCGTIALYRVPAGQKIRSALYDRINNQFFYVCGQDLYRTNLVNSTKLGSLSGSLLPVYTAWEDGILIASGGKLQYYNGSKLLTLEAAPDSDFSYVRAGRVVVSKDKEIRYSAVGNEADWKEDNNSDAASKFIEGGYKDGGDILALINLSQDLLIIKNNGRLYRLLGEYPSWKQVEISRNVDCLGRLCCCAVTNSVFILGDNKLQMINTSQDYGDMKAVNVAESVVNLFCQLPVEPRVIYVPPLNQIWILGTLGRVIVYDLNFNCFYERLFNAEVVDVLSVNDDVFIVKTDSIDQLDVCSFQDSGKPLRWKFWAKRMVSYYDYLLKRVQVSYIPLLDKYEQGPAEVSVGKVIIPLRPAPSSPLIYENDSEIYGNEDLIYPIFNESDGKRCVYRNRYIDIKGSGEGSGVVLDKIMFDVVEV